ncbi:ATP-binding cassette domain-containing protein [Paenibacillus sp. N1-5-1-14]|uniref:ATP-binding cassette domain-containing protein n=1 Tax=Paenibacillus radicibacter TaxID=2972488 RepID=UPI0021594834|nr:ATP-binding cassette domain-containing protein [Paenibacillus radicibacter]MCR8641163.1 ATP-binding cassette domain-containing protein [Paenibacillus radicibacter]
MNVNSSHNEDMLTIRGLSKLYGKGCPDCITLTGPEYGRNICPRCGTIVACADIDLEVYPGEVLGIVGESGSGKSTLVKTLYFDELPTTGEFYLQPYEQGQTNLYGLSAQQKRYVRNHLMGMVYQNPHLGLRLDNTSGGNIAEKLLMADWNHVGNIRKRAKELLTQTQIPIERMDEQPRNFSGGMQQRVQISKALANNPPVLLLDEVTTGLDVSVQARVLDLIRQIQRELGISMIVVSHDFSVIRMLTNRTMVMKNGRIVEKGLTDQIIEDPQHEYTQLLIHSLI